MRAQEIMHVLSGTLTTSLHLTILLSGYGVSAHDAIYNNRKRKFAVANFYNVQL